MPNASFFPNGDSNNGVIKPIPAAIVSAGLISLFNSYGQVVIETIELLKGWDGNWRGKPQRLGKDVRVLKGHGSNCRVINLKGNVALVS